MILSVFSKARSFSPGKPPITSAPTETPGCPAYPVHQLFEESPGVIPRSFCAGPRRPAWSGMCRWGQILREPPMKSTSSGVNSAGSIELKRRRNSSGRVFQGPQECQERGRGSRSSPYVPR